VRAVNNTDSTSSKVVWSNKRYTKTHNSVVTLNIPKPLYLRIRSQVFKAEVENWDAVYGLPAECSTATQKYEYIREQLTFYKKQNPNSNKIAKLLARVDAIRPN
jgi:hypothetical protein